MAPAARISIVTPSFQQAHFLEWTLRSVLAQRYANLEYIVVDGGSTDGSADIIRRYASRLSWWCSESDGGQTQAINKGLRRATGEIVGWLNSDDMLLPGCLHRVAMAFENPSVQAICGWGVMMSEAGAVRRRWVFPQPTAEVLRRQSVLFQPSVFWRRSLHEKIGYLDESFHLTMDQEWFARMATHGVVPRLLPRCLAAYRCHGDTKTVRFGDRGELESGRIAQLYAGGAGARLPMQWRLKDRCLSVLFEKLGLVLPPWWRRRDVHARLHRV